MKIKTGILQNMVAKAIKGSSDNKMIPITSLMGINYVDNKLKLLTTDGSNILTIIEKLELNSLDGAASFYTIVNAETFSKLVAKTTTEYITLTIRENYLEVQGNGTYKLEIPLDEDGKVINFPSSEVNESKLVELNVEELKNSLLKSKVSVAQTMEIPCLTGYYLSDKIITTNREMVSCINKKLLDEPLLISSEMAELLQLIEGEKIALKIENTKMLFINENVEIYGKQLEGIEMYPVKALDGLMDLSYENEIKVNKTELLNVLERMELFVTPYDKNGIKLAFAKDGLLVTSQKSNAQELIDAKCEVEEEFNCLIDIEMLKSQIQVNSSEEILIYYGQEKSIKLVDNDTIIIICLLDENN